MHKQGYRPLRLALVGFKGIYSGLGRDRIDLDLAAQHGAAALVAIAGSNGRGKTTVMDNLHPYLVLPSRCAADGLGGFSYYEHVYLPENEKDLVWSHDGRTFRSHIVIRVNGRRRTEAYLFGQTDTGEWVPAALADGTVSDGKVETYERLIGQILGAPETFFTSVFSAQGKRSLASWRNAEIKTLLGDLLGLERIRQQGARAGEVVRALKSGLAVIRQEQEQAARDRGMLEGEAAAVIGSRERAREASARKADWRRRVEAAHVLLAAAQAQAQAAEVHERRRAEISAQHNALVRQRDGACARIEEELQVCARREQQARARIEQRRRTRAERHAELEGQLEKSRRILASAATVARAQRREGLAARVAGLRAVRLERQAQRNRRLAELNAEAASLSNGIEALEREAGLVTLRQHELVERLRLIKEVPCAGTDLQGRCRLLDDARTAQALRPSVDAQIAALAERRAALRAKRQDAARQAQALADAGARMAEARARVDRAGARARRYGLAAARHGEIAQAAQIAANSSRELQAMADTQSHQDAEDTQELRAAQAERVGRLAHREKVAAEAAQALTRLDEALAQIPSFDPGVVSRAEAALKAAQQELAAIESREAQAMRQAEALQAMENRSRQLQAHEARLAERAAHVERELGYWNLLAKGLSNDGVIALEIDDAGPALASLANDLLLASYGARFTVQICTQSATAKGEIRETFDILVHDGLRGESRSLKHVSGGERVWINECLTRAIALYLAESTGRRFGTLFCDEADGPLDAAHKRMFMDMKREVLRLGGYEREYFVSQTPELTEMADHVIDLDALAMQEGA